MIKLITKISLPPGALEPAVAHQLLALCFERFKWFEPARYGTALTPNRLERSGDWLDTLVDFYEQEEKLSIASNTGKRWLYLLPDRFGRCSYLGRLTWCAPAQDARNAAWREKQLEQVAQVMNLVNSPLTIAALEEDFERKTRHWVREGPIEKQVVNLRDYSEGLAGLFWRNFFGPPFVQLFGRRLEGLPPEKARGLAAGIWLVQPYELPEGTNSEEGRAQEQAMIAQLGEECFYDHERHKKPSRVPDLPPVDED